MGSIAQAFDRIAQFMKWLKEFRQHEHQHDVEKAVRRLRSHAQAILDADPNANTVRTETFWGSCLDDPSLLNEALEATAYRMPAWWARALESEGEFWEVDIGQPNLISKRPNVLR